MESGGILCQVQPLEGRAFLADARKVMLMAVAVITTGLCFFYFPSVAHHSSLVRAEYVAKLSDRPSKVVPFDSWEMEEHLTVRLRDGGDGPGIGEAN